MTEKYKRYKVDILMAEKYSSISGLANTLGN